MKQYRYKKCYELKNAAKDMLNGKYSAAILICFFSFQIQYLITSYTEAFLPSPELSTGVSIPAYAIRCLITLAVDCVLGVMNLGIDLFFLNIACDRSYRLGDLFYGFKNDTSKALTVSGAYTLLGAVCQLPFQYLLIAYWYTGSRELAITALIFALIGICIYLPVSAGLFLSFYLMLDFPEKSAKEILALSFRLMAGNKKRWLYMVFSFVPMMLLCICSFFIGFLWLVPYMKMTYACLFLDIMNPKEETV